MLSRVPYLVWILVIGLILRVISLDQSLWLDEATSILAASRFSFSEIINQFSPGDFHPPAYYLILKIWLSMFGTSEIAARSLSVVLGTGTIYLVYSLTKELFNKKTALISALLLATAPLHIYYSQEARMYVLEALLVVRVVQLFVRITRGASSTLIWISLFTYSCLLLYTDYLPASIFIALALFIFLFDREALKENFPKWVGLGAMLVVSYLPWVPFLQLQLALGSLAKINAPVWWETLGRTDFKQLGLIPLKFTVGRITSHDKVLYYALSAIPVTLYLATIAKSLVALKKTTLIWLWLVIPLALAGMLGLYLSVFSYFRFLFVLPAFYILAAVGTQSLKGKPERVVVALLIACNLALSSIYLLNSNFHREDWRSAVSWVEQGSEGVDAISVFAASNQRDAYYYYQKNIPSYGPVGWEKGNFSKIWLFRYVYPIFDPKDETRRKIESLGYIKIEEKDFNGIVVWEYDK